MSQNYLESHLGASDDERNVWPQNPPPPGQSYGRTRTNFEGREQEGRMPRTGEATGSSRGGRPPSVLASPQRGGMNPNEQENLLPADPQESDSDEDGGSNYDDLEESDEVIEVDKKSKKAAPAATTSVSPVQQAGVHFTPVPWTPQATAPTAPPTTQATAPPAPAQITVSALIRAVHALIADSPAGMLKEELNWQQQVAGDLAKIKTFVVGVCVHASVVTVHSRFTHSRHVFTAVC
jgi:hypothetical protein